MRFILKLFGVLLTACICAVAYMLWHYSKNLPSYEKLAEYKPSQVTRVYSSDLKLIEEYGLEKRTFIPISAIPQRVKNAFIASEDKSFYSHCGIDISGIISVAVNAIPNLIRGKPIRGASTITQQVVKNLLLSSERTLERKIKEIMLALILSKRFSKEQVLELYVNHVYFGSGAYGIASAAKRYFDKSVDEIDLPEIAFLAGLLRSPARYDPTKYYVRAKARRNYVLYRMYENNFIDKACLDESLSKEIELKKTEARHGIYAPYYADYVQDLVTGLLGKEAFYTGGLTIVTSMDSSMQVHANRALIEGIRAYDKGLPYRGPIGHMSADDWALKLSKLERSISLHDLKLGVVLSLNSVGLSDGKIAKLEHGRFCASAKLNVGDVVVLAKSASGYVLSQLPECNGAFFVMHPVSGRVLGMVGGWDYASSKFDRATQANRQIGSLVKTFVYLSALENNIEPNTVFIDEPVEIDLGGSQGIWSPRNYGGRFFGPVTMRTALEKSCNSVPVRLVQELGLGKVSGVLKRFGICKTEVKNFSAVLGAVETTLARVVNAFGILVNGGRNLQPCFVEYIQDCNGRILYRAPDYCRVHNLENGGGEVASFSSNGERVVDEASAYQAVSMMIGVARGGTARAFGGAFGQTVGGKTGTTNDSRDAWFVGFSSNIVAGCYIGHDKPKSLGEWATGSSVALPPVINFFSEALMHRPKAYFKVPANVRLELIDPVSGIPVEDGQGGILEAFKIEPNNPSNLLSTVRWEKRLHGAKDPDYKNKPDSLEIFDDFEEGCNNRQKKGAGA